MPIGLIGVVIGLFRGGRTLISTRIDLRLRETHTGDAELTQLPIESGAVISDHIIRHPNTVTIEAEISNSLGAQPAESWEEFRSQLNMRELYTVVTAHEVYENYALTALTGENSAPFNGRLNLLLTFTEVNLTQTSVILIPREDLDPSVDRGASSELAGGRQDSVTEGDAPARVNESILNRLFSR